MGEEKVSKLLLSFAIPAMLGMIAGAVYNIVDRIFVGQFVGSAGLAAISTAFPTMILMFAFSLLIGVGGSSRVAILRGAKKHRPAEQALATTLTLLMLVGVIGMLLSMFAVEPLLRISGAGDSILPIAAVYLKIILLGGPLALVGHGINSLIRACGSPRYAMTTQIVGAAGNVILDAIFIVGMDMGVMGAALGTVIAQGMATIMGIIFFFLKESPLRIRLHFILRPRIKVIKKICAVGSAPFLVEISFVVFMTLMNQTIYKYGGNNGLSAMGIFFSLDSLFFMPAMAIGEAMQPIVGYNYGAGKPQRVIETIKKALALVTAFYILSAAFAEIFAENLMMLFTSDPALLEIGVPGMRIGYIGIVFFGVTIITNSALQGLGKAKESLILSLIRHMAFMFLPMIILPRIFGMLGVWISFPLGDALGCVLAYLFLRRLIKWLKTPDAVFIK